jgi:c-di-AMP phosphodiesterase-like protein
MDFTNDITKIKGLLETAQDVLIVTHEHPTHDSIGSALALSLGLTSLGKKVTVACPDPMIVELSNYVGAQKIVNVLGKKNFVISLDYVEGSIEKVSYNIEGDKFNLVIEPRVGFDTFSEDKVHYSHSGQSAQLIFTVDTIHLGGLKKLYEDDKDLYASKPIVNIDRHANNAHFGHTNMVDDSASSTAEIVHTLLVGLGVGMSEDIATNLLNAVYAATQNFQMQTIKASAFELAAKAVAAGGKRFATRVVQEEITHGGESVASEPKKIEQSVPVTTQAPAAAPVVPPQPALPVQAAPKPQKAPPEWLKPKIFKSSNIS